MDGSYSKLHHFHLYVCVLALVCLCSLRDPCNGLSNVSCIQSQEEALLKFKNGLIDPSNRLESWQHGTDCCKWEGIQCGEQNGYVTSIDLQNPSVHRNLPFDSYVEGSNSLDNSCLRGQLDPALADLERLQSLDLRFNAFNGTKIPEFLGSMKELLHLDLSYAGFQGYIPYQIGNLSKLEFLDVSSLVRENVHVQMVSIDFRSWNGVHTSYLSSDNLHWLAGLASLKYLTMNQVNLSAITHADLRVFSSLPSLEQLNLSSCSLSVRLIFPPANFSSLQRLDLSKNYIFSKFPSWVTNITTLRYLDLSSNLLEGELSYDLSELPYLNEIDVRKNHNLRVNVSRLFAGAWRNATKIYLGFTDLRGRLPSSIGKISSLQGLNLYCNPDLPCGLEGNIPKEIGKLQNLRSLRLKFIRYEGSFPLKLSSPYTLYTLELHGVDLQNAVNLEWFCQFKVLHDLILDSCNLTGTIPTCLAELSSLQYLSVRRNHLNGTIPQELGKLFHLNRLDLSSNSLEGVVYEDWFQKLQNLKYLDLSYNSLAFRPKDDWIPPSKLVFIYLAACQIGPRFPLWLKNHEKFERLVLSSNVIEGSLPWWFWDKVPQLYLLNLSDNNIEGQLPNPFRTLPIDDFVSIDLSFNRFSGSLPRFLGGVQYISLANNQFSGSIPHDVGTAAPSLKYLFASTNKLSGSIPPTIGEMKQLVTLDLSANELSSNIPWNLVGSLNLQVLDLSRNLLSGETTLYLANDNSLKSLHLGTNELCGKFPLWLKNCTNLEVLDLSKNKFSDEIPQWIGESCTSLQILDLSTNIFTGKIPSELSEISSLQILNVAENQLSGSIPKSFGNFKAMKKKHVLGKRFIRKDGYYQETLTIKMNGRADQFTRSLSLVNSLDLSRNLLSGGIPREITHLLELIVLDVSYNRLVQAIPEDIGALNQLLSLDLSHNHLSGELPLSLAKLFFLSHMNLSYNNFSGEIPFGYQLRTLDDSSIYIGNPGLCGFPLKRNCSYDKLVGMKQEGEEDEDEGHLEMSWFYISIGVGFVVGLSGVSSILIIKASWRNAYFHLFDDGKDCLCGVFLVKFALLKRRIRENSNY